MYGCVYGCMDVCMYVCMTSTCICFSLVFWYGFRAPMDLEPCKGEADASKELTQRILGTLIDPNEPQ